MPEITTRLGPLRLLWEIEHTEADGKIIEVFATLMGVSDDTFWREHERFPQWPRNKHDARWQQLCEWIEETHWEHVATSDQAYAAIERERLDLAREDAERFAN